MNDDAPTGSSPEAIASAAQVRRLGRLAALDIAVWLTCAVVLSAKQSGLLGNFHTGGRIFVTIMFFAGPALFPLAATLLFHGLGRYGHNLPLFGGLALLGLSVPASMLSFFIAALGMLDGKPF